MSADITEEMKDLIDIYGEGADHFRNKQEQMLPVLVSLMKEFCSAYDQQILLEDKYDALKQKLDIVDEEEGDDE